MTMHRFLIWGFSLLLVGAGCTPPPVPPLQTAKAPPKTEESKLPCLVFNEADGFKKWVDAYQAGDTSAKALARQALLPELANLKLTSDIRASIKEGATPSFLCALDDMGSRVVWVMESGGDTMECHDTFYVSIEGSGTVSELSAKERRTNCSQLCKPKRQDADLLVWQCDVRETDTGKQWSQMNMSRITGGAEIVQCQQDSLGVPSGCLP